MVFSTLALGLTRQTRVVTALTIREVRLRNSKHAFSQFFDLLEAIVYIIGHWILFVFLQRKLLIGDSLLLFMATGLVPVLFFRTISIRVASAIEAAKTVVAVPYIEPIDYAIARSFVEVVSFIIAFGVFFLLIYGFGISKYAIPYNIGAVTLFIVITYFFSFGLGLINSFIAFLFPLWKFIWAMFSRIQIFFSAIFYIPEYMPPRIKEIVSYNPIMHLVSIFRVGFYPTYPTHLLSVQYVLGWTCAVLVIGLALERALRNHRNTLSS